MKSRREHRVPLSPRAVELVGPYREGGNSHVFIGARTGAALGNMAMPDVLQQMEQSDVTVHGFRLARALSSSFPPTATLTSLNHRP